jgi:hypothetical protein
MRKDAIYRRRVPRRTIAAIKKVAAAKGEDVSEWGRAIIDTELRRDLAALELRDQLRTARAGSLTEDEAMGLVEVPDDAPQLQPAEVTLSQARSFARKPRAA